MIITNQLARNSPAAGAKFEVGGGAELAAAAEEEFIIYIDLTVKGSINHTHLNRAHRSSCWQKDSLEAAEGRRLVQQEPE